MLGFTCVLLLSYCRVVLLNIFLSWNKEFGWCQGITSYMCEATWPPEDLQLLHYGESYFFIYLLLHWPTHIAEITKHMTVELLGCFLRNHPSYKYKVPRNILGGICNPWNIPMYWQYTIKNSHTLVLLHIVNQYCFPQHNRNKTIHIFSNMIVKL